MSVCVYVCLCVSVTNIRYDTKWIGSQAFIVGRGSCWTSTLQCTEGHAGVDEFVGVCVGLDVLGSFWE